MTRAVAYLVVAGLMATPALAAAGGWADIYDPALTMNVRDTDRDMRATLRYFPEVMIGGSEMVVGEDGEEYELLWDGVSGLFEAELLDGAVLDAAGAEGFLREAIPVLCPSVNLAEVFQYNDVSASGPFLAIYGQCPAVDVEVRK